MPTAVRAIRGATTIDLDKPEHITDRVQELVSEVFERNDVDTDELISIIFTATADITSMYPATAARAMGLDDVPLFGAQELVVENMLPQCIRILVHLNTDKSRDSIDHVYLHDARRLRVDLVR
jgi:chorismate mutase